MTLGTAGVGWLSPCETHHVQPARKGQDGFAALNPSYSFAKDSTLC